jgi:hypothetical protein
MSIETFQGFLEEIVAPMFPGATLEQSQFAPKVRLLTTVVSESPTLLRLRQNTSTKDYYSLKRLQRWRVAEKKLVKKLISSYETTSNAGRLLPHLEGYIVRKAIAEAIGINPKAQSLELVLEILSKWSSQTYEGERVSFGILIDPSVEAPVGTLSLFDMMAEDFSKVLSDGVDSWWKVDMTGRILGFQTYSNSSARHAAYAPIRYAALAGESDERRVGITLNRNGEILIFTERSIRFAHRRGKWLRFTHGPTIERMSNGGPCPVSLRAAIYQSCLEASFARTGACICFIRSWQLGAFYSSNLVPREDLLANSQNLKARSAGKLIDQKLFHEIPQIIRKELLGMDGALVIGPRGDIIAAGAIVDLQNVSRGNTGGRSAAAKALCQFGLGIKVSEDGMITGFRFHGQKAVEDFKLA